MSTGKLMSAGIVSAIAASLCCITPVLALIAGSGSIASSFSWIEPARPYLIGVTIAVLGFAWYLKLKPQPTDDCGCAVDEKPKFLQTKTFLLLVTVFATLMIVFPSYAKAFFSQTEKKVLVVEKSNIQTAELNIKGMSCEACEEEVKHEVNRLPGIIEAAVSYKNKNAIIKFDVSKTNIKHITDAVNATGYNVINYTIKK
ncbi:MAG: mercuric transport protein MerTP [Proteobacteria bacterium]|nr:mercuric transport protein MerTP [Pseudomonadota bacterium]